MSVTLTTPRRRKASLFATPAQNLINSEREAT